MSGSARECHENRALGLVRKTGSWAEAAGCALDPLNTWEYSHGVFVFTGKYVSDLRILRKYVSKNVPISHRKARSSRYCKRRWNRKSRQCVFNYLHYLSIHLFFFFLFFFIYIFLFISQLHLIDKEKINPKRLSANPLYKSEKRKYRRREVQKPRQRL